MAYTIFRRESLLMIGIALTLLLLSLLPAYAIQIHVNDQNTVTWEWDGSKDGNSPHQHHDSHAFYFDNGQLGDEYSSPNGLYTVNAHGVWDNETRINLWALPPDSQYPHGFIDERLGSRCIPDYFFMGDWSSVDAQKARQNITAAFEMWDAIKAESSSVSGSKLETGIAFEETKNSADAEIFIYWEDLTGNLGFHQAYWDGKKHLNTTVIFDSNPVLNVTHQGWFFGKESDTPNTKYHFFSTALHEIGHVVGLYEQTDTDDVMIKERKPGRNNPPFTGPAFDVIDSDSVDAVKDLYSIPVRVLNVTIYSGSHIFHAEKCLFGNDNTWYMWFLFTPEISLGSGEQTSRITADDVVDKLHGEPDYFKMSYEIDGASKVIEIGSDPPFELGKWYTLPDPPLQEEAQLIVTVDSLQSSPGVGGVVVPVDKFGLLAPYIGLASTMLIAIATTSIYVKRLKRKKEKQ